MKKKTVGIVGVPPLAVIKTIESGECALFDLDEPIVRESVETASPFLPRVYCAVLRTVVVNSLALKPDIIYIDVGPGKCDGAFHTAGVLESLLPGTKIVRTRNQDAADYGVPLCRTRMNLLEKMRAITLSVQSSTPHQELPACTPDAGFWGAPPRDFSILKLFPDTTHVYGWTRCMENKTA